MHGHSLCGTRKLNRHWQSGGSLGVPGENLVYFEKQLNTQDECPTNSDNPLYHVILDPYIINSFRSHANYNGNLADRTLEGFRPLSIIQPGNYQLHWTLDFRKLEKFTKNGVEHYRFIDGDINDKIGMFGAIMYGAAQPFRAQKPDYVINGSLAGSTYYVGGAGDYLADGDGLITPLYADSNIVKYVTPSRLSTRSFNTPSSFNIASSNEQPPIIFHIGGKAPFYDYQFTYNNTNHEVYFHEDGRYRSPEFQFPFCYNHNTVTNHAAMTGRIWLERIGDYTQDGERFLPRILTVPNGYTIKGNGGII